MKIKDPAHAVRVLKFLTEEKDLWMPYMDGTPGDELLYALFEGAKAVLNDLYRLEIGGWHTTCTKAVIMSLAQTYAPRMKEAGMKVPE